MLKKLSRLVFLLGLFLVLMPIQVYAATYTYSMAFTVSNTTGSDLTGACVLVPINSGQLYDSGYIQSDASDTYLTEGTSPISYSVGSSYLPMFIPSILDTQSRGYRYYLGYSTAKTSFPIMVGPNGGYFTTPDGMTEPGNNFHIYWDGYLSDGYLGYKAGAYDCYVSGGTLTAQIYAAEGYVLEQTSSTTAWEFVNGSGGSRRAQVITTTVDWWVTSVDIYGEEEGTASQTYYVSIYSTSGGVPTGSALVTSGTLSGTVFPAVGAPDYVTFTFSSPMFIPSGTTIAIVFGTNDTTDASNNIHWMVYHSSVIDGSRYTAYSTPSWSLVNTYDARFRITGYAPSKTLSTAVTSGEQLVELYADGTDFKVDIDSVNKDTVALAGASVNNTAYDWYWGSDGAFGYLTSLKYDASGVQKLWYEPTGMYSTSLTDRSGNGNTGTVTWGANLAGITVTLQGLEQYTTYISPGGGTAVIPEMFPPASMPDMGGEAGTGAGMPMYSSVHKAATALGMSTGTMYGMLMMIVATCMGFAGLVASNSVIGFSVLFGATSALSFGATYVPAWFGFFGVLIALFLGYAFRSA